MQEGSSFDLSVLNMKEARRLRPILAAKLTADVFFVNLELLHNTRRMRFLAGWFILNKILEANGQDFDREYLYWARKSQHELWDEMCRQRPRLTGRARAASVIARRWRIFREAQKERAARRIQAGCRNWIHKPITRDGKLGLNMRIIMKWRGAQRQYDKFLLLCQ